MITQRIRSGSSSSSPLPSAAGDQIFFSCAVVMQSTGVYWIPMYDVLEQHGFDLEPEWFAAQLEFRFPFCGEAQYEGMTLTLNQALEPWHVMGEQGAIGGTVRHTDSSVERMQVKLTAPDPGRYIVTCNRRSVTGRPAGSTRWRCSTTGRARRSGSR